ncbi:MAG: hypothetical protein JXR63_00845 [Spirochaetales bacterium]|nr:hypothetical protein [Spirochaetales bacterium]
MIRRSAFEGKMKIKEYKRSPLLYVYLMLLEILSFGICILMLFLGADRDGVFFSGISNGLLLVFPFIGILYYISDKKIPYLTIFNDTLIVNCNPYWPSKILEISQTQATKIKKGVYQMGYDIVPVKIKLRSFKRKQRNEIESFLDRLCVRER